MFLRERRRHLLEKKRPDYLKNVKFHMPLPEEDQKLVAEEMERAKSVGEMPLLDREAILEEAPRLLESMEVSEILGEEEIWGDHGSDFGEGADDESEEGSSGASEVAKPEF